MGDLERIFAFIIELDKLKGVLRKTKPVGFSRHENSAEHSWQVALLALMVAPQAREPVDIVRVVEILLVHDIPEIDAGDQIVYRGASQARAAAERRAAERIFGLLPEAQATWCLSRWEEYESRASKEAVFAYAVDRLMPVLHNLSNGGQSWRENRVPLEKIRALNAVVGEVFPAAWEHIQARLSELEASGFFREEENGGA